MLSLLTQSISNASFGIYLPQIRRHDLRGPLGADLATFEIVFGYVGAAATKSIILGADHPRHRARCSCRCDIEHPFWMLVFLVLTR